jgi:histone H3/H4
MARTKQVEIHGKEPKKPSASGIEKPEDDKKKRRKSNIYYLKKKLSKIHHRSSNGQALFRQSPFKTYIKKMLKEVGGNGYGISEDAYHLLKSSIEMKLVDFIDRGNMIAFSRGVKCVNEKDLSVIRKLGSDYFVYPDADLVTRQKDEGSKRIISKILGIKQQHLDDEKDIAA